MSQQLKHCHKWLLFSLSFHFALGSASAADKIWIAETRDGVYFVKNWGFSEDTKVEVSTGSTNIDIDIEKVTYVTTEFPEIHPAWKFKITENDGSISYSNGPQAWTVRNSNDNATRLHYGYLSDAFESGLPATVVLPPSPEQFRIWIPLDAIYKFRVSSIQSAAAINNAWPPPDMLGIPPPAETLKNAILSNDKSLKRFREKLSITWAETNCGVYISHDGDEVTVSKQDVRKVININKLFPKAYPCD